MSIPSARKISWRNAYIASLGALAILHLSSVSALAAPANDAGFLPTPPDHRPIAVINFYGANFDSDPECGRNQHWTNPATAEDWVMRMLRRLYYNLGYTRINLRLPGGTRKKAMMSSNQMYCMTDFQLAALDKVADFAKNSGITLSLYMGFVISDQPDNFSLKTNHPPFSPDEFGSLLDPWVQRYNIREFFLDWASPQHERYLLTYMAHDFAKRGIKLIGEAIPKAWEDKNKDYYIEPQTNLWARAPWLATYRFAKLNKLDKKVVDPSQTDLTIGLLPDDPVDEAFIQSIMDRGFSIMAWGAKAQEAVARLSNLKKP